MLSENPFAEAQAAIQARDTATAAAERDPFLYQWVIDLDRRDVDVPPSFKPDISRFFVAERYDIFFKVRRSCCGPARELPPERADSRVYWHPESRSSARGRSRKGPKVWRGHNWKAGAADHYTFYIREFPCAQQDGSVFSYGSVFSVERSHFSDCGDRELLVLEPWPLLFADLKLAKTAARVLCQTHECKSCFMWVPIGPFNDSPLEVGMRN
jgi:hypothetical protein